ncbi:hypothetical protein [Ectothiorhodospira sp. BSL-9]|uniref:hypothetical protein n=1 Tax=Ectothiorhodospira sp. BSL-9 TaxID=1442136 RepID=UPI0007B44E3F|nr:hypothetical protein [Ectothiorhodospira sp. BSL-9]ANB03020.1 hypothetical protein ECTOBSL9_2569 [Ectothiorhodospira sp. BSL-9]
MPLPLIVPIAVGLAGLYGAGKGAKAAIDNSDAKDLNRRSERIVEEAQNSIENSRLECHARLEDLGKRKLKAIEVGIGRFVDVYSRMENVELDDFNLNENGLPQKKEETPELMMKEFEFLAESGKGVGAGALGGGLAAFGAYNGTMMLAASGTTTAISSLSGAAATNATLAWLGGGTLASGGLGMAGGVMVLGTLAAGPALLIFGSILGAKADKNLSDAKANLEKAKTFEEESKLVIARLTGIIDAATLASNVISKARSRLRRSLDALEKVQSTQGVDYRSYSREQKEVVVIAVKYTQLIRVLVELPLLSEKGDLIEASVEDLRQKNKELA